MTSFNINVHVLNAEFPFKCPEELNQQHHEIQMTQQLTKMLY